MPGRHRAASRLFVSVERGMVIVDSWSGYHTRPRGGGSIVLSRNARRNSGNALREQRTLSANRMQIAHCLLVVTRLQLYANRATPHFDGDIQF